MNSLAYPSFQKKLDIIHEKMFDSMGYHYIFDLKGRVLSVNRNSVNDSHWSLSEILGKSAFSAESEKYSEMYQKNCQIALQKKARVVAYEVIETCRQETRIMVTHKEPLVHDGEIIGVVGHSLAAPEGSVVTPSVFSEDLIFIDLKRKQRIKLSPQQKKVVYWSLQGLSAKEVGTMMGLSHRTVEHYLEAAKKANAYTSVRDIILNVRAV